MRLRIDALPDRVAAALLGAAAGEQVAGSAAGVRQLLDLAESLAAHDGLDEADLRARGLDAAPAAGPAALLLRGVVAGLLSPLDRPRLRRTAHRTATVAHADEGTAMTVVAAAVLAADLCRFDLETAVVRVRQTLLEEAPAALLGRLGPLPEGAPLVGGGTDPGASLQLALSALDRAATVPSVLDEVATWDGDLAGSAPLAGALAGCRTALAGADPAWQSAVPAASRCLSAAQALSARAMASLPA